MLTLSRLQGGPSAGSPGCSLYSCLARLYTPGVDYRQSGVPVPFLKVAVKGLRERLPGSQS